PEVPRVGIVDVIPESGFDGLGDGGEVGRLGVAPDEQRVRLPPRVEGDEGEGEVVPVERGADVALVQLLAHAVAHPRRLSEEPQARGLSLEPDDLDEVAEAVAVEPAA